MKPFIFCDYCGSTPIDISAFKQQHPDIDAPTCCEPYQEDIHHAQAILAMSEHDGLSYGFPEEIEGSTAEQLQRERMELQLSMPLTQAEQNLKPQGRYQHDLFRPAPPHTGRLWD